MKTNIRLFVSLLAISSLFVAQSCDKDDDPVLPASNGFFVVNEGAFGNGNSSISFYDRALDEVQNNIFQAKNGRALGDQAQSMTIHEGRGYVVVQNSAKVEVIDVSDYSSIKTITTGLESPRYFIGISATKGYLSDWGSTGVTGTVKVIDLQSLAVVKTISTGEGANRFLRKGDRVFVANAGGFGKDNTVKVIDINTDEVVATVTVGDNPTSLQMDNDGNIWIASAGNLVYNTDFSINETASTKSSLTRIRADLTEIIRLTFSKATYGSLSALEINSAGDRLYYNFDGAIYSMSTAATSLPATPLIAKTYYGIAVDPFNGNVIGLLAPNFSSAGKADVYSPEGTLIKSYNVGIAPNGCAF